MNSNKFFKHNLLKGTEIREIEKLINIMWDFGFLVTDYYSYIHPEIKIEWRFSLCITLWSVHYKSRGVVLYLSLKDNVSAYPELSDIKKDL